MRAESAGPDVHDLETKLNGYVRLYTDSQSEVEKLKLDARRAEQNSEAEKVWSATLVLLCVCVEAC